MEASRIPDHLGAVGHLEPWDPPLLIDVENNALPQHRHFKIHGNDCTHFESYQTSVSCKSFFLYEDSQMKFMISYGRIDL